MTNKGIVGLKAVPAVQYHAAIARAVEWLGYRYFLANPIRTAAHKFRLRVNRWPASHGTRPSTGNRNNCAGLSRPVPVRAGRPHALESGSYPTPT
jgi:hypothetical protein